MSLDESKRTSAEAAAIKSEAAVEMARALHIRQEAGREVIETQEINTKVPCCVDT